jgi:hypothetical protein
MWLSARSNFTAFVKQIPFFSVIISQESENKLKIIRQIFENLLPGNRHESPEGSLWRARVAIAICQQV